MQESSLAKFFKQRKGKIKKKQPPMEAQIYIMRAQDVQGKATYVCMSVCLSVCGYVGL